MFFQQLVILYKFATSRTILNQIFIHLLQLNSSCDLSTSHKFINLSTARTLRNSQSQFSIISVMCSFHFLPFHKIFPQLGQFSIRYVHIFSNEIHHVIFPHLVSLYLSIARTLLNPICHVFFQDLVNS